MLTYGGISTINRMLGKNLGPNDINEIYDWEDPA
jgi:hypothetical protein